MQAAPVPPRRRLELGPLTVLLFIALFAIGTMILLRQAGALRPAELAGHDLIVTLGRHLPSRPDPGVVVLGIDSRDKVALDWPLPDSVVTDVVEKLASLEPAAIGLDFFRGDRPVGPLGAAADPAETDRLVARLEATPNVVVILDTFRAELPQRLVRLASPEIDRVASPTLVPDEDDVLRRGILGDVFPDPEVAEPVLGLWSLSAALVRLATADEALVPRGPVAEDAMPLGRRVVPPLAAGAGPYAGSDLAGGGYEFLASWPVPDLPVLRLADLLEGRLDPALVRGKIVLVGATARSVGDMVTSPILGQASKAALPGRTVFGVEAHAQFTAQLLMEARGQVPPLAPAPPLSWIAALAVASLGGAAAGGLIARPVVSLPVLVLGCLVWPAAALGAFSAGWWVAWVPALSGWILSAVLAFVLVASRERRQRARMAGLFRTYLPPAVADTLWANRDRLMQDDRPIPQSMVASVLFSDIRGFTKVSEIDEPGATAGLAGGLPRADDRLRGGAGRHRRRFHGRWHDGGLRRAGPPRRHRRGSRRRPCRRRGRPLDPPAPAASIGRTGPQRPPRHRHPDRHPYRNTGRRSDRRASTPAVHDPGRHREHGGPPGKLVGAGPSR